GGRRWGGPARSSTAGERAGRTPAVPGPVLLGRVHLPGRSITVGVKGFSREWTRMDANRRGIREGTRRREESTNGTNGTNEEPQMDTDREGIREGREGARRE